MPCQSPYRQTLAIANRLAGMSAPEAMRQAGYSPSYTDHEACRFFSRPEIASRMTKALEKANPAVVELAAQAVTEALTAEPPGGRRLSGQGCGLPGRPGARS